MDANKAAWIARAFLIARELIEQHGDDVGRLLQDKIDALMASADLEQLSVWFVIRNAVALSLQSDATLHQRLGGWRQPGND